MNKEPPSGDVVPHWATDDRGRARWKAAERATEIFWIVVFGVATLCALASAVIFIWNSFPRRS